MNGGHQALQNAESFVDDFGQGARQFVVQDALEIAVMSLRYPSWLTLITNMGASFEGAVITTL